MRSYANVDELEGSTRDYMYAHFFMISKEEGKRSMLPG